MVVSVQSFQLLNPRSRLQRAGLSVKVGLARTKKGSIKSEVTDAVKSSTQRFPWSYKKNVTILIDMNTVSKETSVVLEIEDEKSSKVGYGIVLLSDLSDQKEHDDWYPIFEKKDVQIGWIHLHMHLEKPKTVMDRTLTTKNASEIGDVSKKPEIPSKAADSLDILDNKYVNLKLLGAGNFGKCYRAKNQVDDQMYAVKLIPCKTDKQLSDIKREAKVLWSMQHRYITRYFSAFRHKEFFCVVMEFCSGGNLNDVITKARQDKLTPKLTIRQVKLWVSQISEALAYLKTLNLLHRDLKGDNVFLSDGRVKLADFGLAASAQLVRGQAGAYAYESPEQAQGHRYGAPNDAWALGCMVTELTSLKFVSERTKQQIFANDASACAGAVHEVARIDPTLGQISAGLLEPNQNTRMTPENVIGILANDLRAMATSGAMLFNSGLSTTFTAPIAVHPGQTNCGGGAVYLDY